MLRAPFLTITILILLTAFQNCGDLRSVDKSPNTEETQQLSSLKDIEKIEIPPGNPFSPIFSLVIDLKSGRITQKTTDQTLERCLPKDLQDRLQTFLDSSDICKTPAAPPGRNCTLEYRFPHSIMHAKSESVKLGERASGCAELIDFCNGEKEKYFELIREDLLPNLSSFSCSNE